MHINCCTINVYLSGTVHVCAYNHTHVRINIRVCAQSAQLTYIWAVLYIHVVKGNLRKKNFAKYTNIQYSQGVKKLPANLTTATNLALISPKRGLNMQSWMCFTKFYFKQMRQMGIQKIMCLTSHMKRCSNTGKRAMPKRQPLIIWLSEQDRWDACWGVCHCLGDKSLILKRVWMIFGTACKMSNYHQRSLKASDAVLPPEKYYRWLLVVIECFL